MVLRENVWYGIIVAVGLTTLVHAIFTALIIGYLNSKPPLNQTILDTVNVLLFSSLMSVALYYAIVRWIISIWKDCGENLALVVVWCGHYLLIMFFSLIMASVLTQTLIFSQPSLLDSCRQEF